MESKRHTQVLVEKAKCGHRDAFEKLVDLYRGDLETYARLRVVGRLGQNIDIEEVLQETYVRALQSIRRFQWRTEDSFLLWLKGIVNNVVLKLAHERQRDQVLYLDRDVPADDVSPSKALRRGDRFDRFQEALASLPRDYREVVLLARIEGLRIKEVAERLNRSPKATAHLLSRALQRLKDAFGETESLHLPPRRFGDPEAGDVK